MSLINAFHLLFPLFHGFEKCSIALLLACIMRIVTVQKKKTKWNEIDCQWVISRIIIFVGLCSTNSSTELFYFFYYLHSRVAESPECKWQKKKVPVVKMRKALGIHIFPKCFQWIQHIQWQKIFVITRMHSSRMRTDHRLTISGHVLEGLSSQGRGCGPLSQEGVSAHLQVTHPQSHTPSHTHPVTHTQSHTPSHTHPVTHPRSHPLVTHTSLLTELKMPVNT